MASEKTYFEYDDVKVTNARFVSGSQTFAMSNITSVKAFEKKPNRTGGVVAVLIGLMVALKFQAAVGLLIIGLAAMYLYYQKTVFHVMLATAGGEVSALKTYQRNYLESVVGAVNQAMVERG